MSFAAIRLTVKMRQWGFLFMRKSAAVQFFSGAFAQDFDAFISDQSYFQRCFPQTGKHLFLFDPAFLKKLFENLLTSVYIHAILCIVYIHTFSGGNYGYYIEKRIR